MNNSMGPNTLIDDAHTPTLTHSHTHTGTHGQGGTQRKSFLASRQFFFPIFFVTAHHIPSHVNQQHWRTLTSFFFFFSLSLSLCRFFSSFLCFFLFQWNQSKSQSGVMVTWWIHRITGLETQHTNNFDCSVLFLKCCYFFFFLLLLLLFFSSLFFSPSISQQRVSKFHKRNAPELNNNWRLSEGIFNSMLQRPVGGRGQEPMPLVRAFNQLKLS